MKAKLGAQSEEGSREGRRWLPKKLSGAVGTEIGSAINEGLLLAIYSLGSSALTANQRGSLLPVNACSPPPCPNSVGSYLALSPRPAAPSSGEL